MAPTPSKKAGAEGTIFQILSNTLEMVKAARMEIAGPSALVAVWTCAMSTTKNQTYTVRLKYSCTYFQLAIRGRVVVFSAESNICVFEFILCAYDEHKYMTMACMHNTCTKSCECRV